MISSACWVVSKPLGVELSALGIRTAWAVHGSGYGSKLLFAEEGVWCLVGDLGYHTSMLRDFLEAEGEVLCVREDLQRRGIDEGLMLQGVTVVDAADVAGVCEDCDTVNYF